MALDGCVLHALAAELHAALAGGKIDKVYQPGRGELVLGVRTRDKNYKVLLSANPSLPRAHLTESSFENPAKPPMFCMLLRKHLISGRIASVEQYAFERILHFSIEGYDELGEKTVRTLVLELMGKHSNLILLGGDGKIIDSIYHVDMTVSSVRQVLPGLPYETPPSKGKYNPLLLGGPPALDPDGSELSKQLLQSFMGISPLVAREAVYRALGKTECTPDEAGPDGLQTVGAAFYDMMQQIKQGDCTPVILSDAQTGKPMEFCALPIRQYEGLANCEGYPTISQAIEQFYAKKAQGETLRQRGGDLMRVVANNLDRCHKKLQLQNERLQKAAKRDKYKLYGDLVTANLHRVQKGAEHITVQNFYDPDGGELQIALKNDLTPAQNAQRYYTRYNKEKTAATETEKQKELNLAEIDYLESVQDAIAKAETAAEITQIRDELIEQGYLKNKGRVKKNKKPELPKPMHFVSADGYDIFVGKNNKQNDYVTCRLARPTDLWFHTKGIHGSHTLVQTADAMQVPDETYRQAALLAAYYSKGRASQSVPVDYTEARNVKKPAGAKPGMVIYVDYSTLYVTPDETEIAKIKKLP